ncbi:hypothetical protein C2869_17240 [Saccharobesus litoralis]|uniref:Uncharacterized protein n=2 Tax=Saccharobesus litoralis TaxID=2172099 RepID=A0A2S0VV24_9ALTE|nr:hypothetical protein C2869_17240 [Saccharobesus litoralis]
MELFVIVALDQVTNTESFNNKAKEHSVPIVFEENINLMKHTGFLPSTTKSQKSGVEVYSIKYTDIESMLPPNEELKITNPTVITFRWGGDFFEGATAMYAAAVLIANNNGLAFEPISNMYLDNTQLIEGAEAMLSYSQ